MDNKLESYKIAVLIPCFNEETAIAAVVRDFRKVLPSAEIHVFDNASTDQTARIASDAGAIVWREPRPGKGAVVRRMMEVVDADFFLMVDGDDTYPAEKAPALLWPVIDCRADMMVGTRLQEFTTESFRPLHVFGNHLIRSLINFIFSAQLTDILSGYRAYNRRVRDLLPLVSSGFDIETEITAQMLNHRLTIGELPVPYRERPPGSLSKLNTFRDGFLVLWRIFCLVRDFKPFTFFGLIALFCLAVSFLAGSAPILDYIRERYVHHVPLALLASAFGLLSFGSFALGVLLHVINWRIRELHSVLVRRCGSTQPLRSERIQANVNVDD